MYKKHLITLLTCLLVVSSYAQTTTSFVFEIQFSKKNDTLYSISDPGKFLSQEAIDRRVKQKIVIGERDLPLNYAFLDSVESKGFHVLAKSKWLNLVVVSVEDSTFIDSLGDFSWIAEKRFIGKKSFSKRSLQKFEKATEEGILEQGFNQMNLAGGEYLFLNNYRGKGKKIAITDAGFDGLDNVSGFDHLKNDGRILGTYDFVNDQVDVDHSHSHGLQVFSVLAAHTPNKFYGTAVDASYYLFITEDVGSEHLVEEYHWVEAAEKADSLGVDIINVSLGYKEFDDSTFNHTKSDLIGDQTIMARGANIAFSTGMIVVVSAGNSGLEEDNYIGTPADAQFAFTIGAIDNDGDFAGLSSRGNPSLSYVKPNVVAVGEGTTILNIWVKDVYVQANGTSFSSPIISGLMASLWQAMPDIGNSALQQLVQESASQYSTPDTLMGYGIPNFSKVFLKYIGDSSAMRVKVYPNPTSDFVYITAHGDHYITSVELIGYDGRIVQKEEGIRFRQLKKSLPQRAGVYLLKVSGDQFTQWFKIVKQ